MNHTVCHVIIIITAISLKLIRQGLKRTKTDQFAHWGLKDEAIQVKRNIILSLSYGRACCSDMQSERDTFRASIVETAARRCGQKVISAVNLATHRVKKVIRLKMDAWVLRTLGSLRRRTFVGREYGLHPFCGLGGSGGGVLWVQGRCPKRCYSAGT